MAPLCGAIVIWGYMYICYIDESGDSGTLNLSDPLLNPFFVISGLIIKHSCLIDITEQFLNTKKP